MPNGPFAIVDPGSRREPFTLHPGPAFRIDFPVDPSGASLYIVKTVNKEIAAIGDFLQYVLNIENTTGAGIENLSFSFLEVRKAKAKAA